MDFSLSEEQVEVQALARRLFDELASHQRQNAVDAGSERFDPALWRQLAESGLLGLAVDTDYGGMGYGFETLCLLLEEAGRAVAPLPLLPCLVSAALPLQRFGSQQQKRRWLPGLASGDLLISAALVEPRNDDPLKPACSAQFHADGCVLQGVKHAVPFADRAERVLLSARSKDGPLLVLLDPASAGVTSAAQRSSSGEPWFELRLDAVRIEPAEILAQGEAAKLALGWLAERSTAAHCAMAVGATEAMLRLTAKYTSERHQFGRPIASFQAVGQRAADCYIDIEALRLVTQQAVALLDQELEAAEAVLTAKIWCGDVTHRVSQAAQHLHGGMGTDRDYPLFRYCLLCKQIELALGSSSSALAALGERIADALLDGSASAA